MVNNCDILRRKIVVGLLICSGFFVIAAAIIRVVLTLGASPSGTNINRWGVRETIVGIVSVNIPILRPMFTAAFWTGRKPASSSYSSSMPHTRYGHTRYGRTRTRTATSAAGPYEMTGGGESSSRETASHENILGADKTLGNGIYVETAFHIRSEDARRAMGTEGWSPRSTMSRADVCGASDVV